MADALVAAALREIPEALLQMAELFLGATDDLTKLSSAFLPIQTVLHDAERKQVTLSKLRNTAYDVDGLLEEQLLSGVGGDGARDDGIVGKKVLAILVSLLTRRMKEIRERLNQIADDESKSSFGGGGRSGGDRMLGESRLPAGSFVESSEMIGGEGEKQIMIDQLVSWSSHEDGQLCVLAVDGSGGTGKRTLSQESCCGEMVHALFNEIFGMAEIFDIVRITRAFLEDPFFGELNLMEGKLEVEWLLVSLDDVWNECEEKINIL